jgi:hypothetical protein
MTRMLNRAVKEAEDIGIISSDELAKIGQNAADAAKNGRKFTEPTLPKGGTPDGVKAKPDPKDTRPIDRQNEAADLLAAEGYDVKLLPENITDNPYGLKSGKFPDYLIDGVPFDCYSPDTLSVRNIWSVIADDKTINQAKRIILNLDDYKGSMDAIAIQFNQWKITTLDELLIIKDGKICRLVIN